MYNLTLFIKKGNTMSVNIIKRKGQRDYLAHRVPTVVSKLSVPMDDLTQVWNSYINNEYGLMNEGHIDLVKDALNKIYAIASAEHMDITTLTDGRD